MRSGAEALLIFGAFSARLKSCPVTTPGPPRVSLRAVQSCAVRGGLDDREFFRGLQSPSFLFSQLRQSGL